MHFESFRRFNTLFLEILPLALRSLATPTSLVGLAVFLRPCNPPPPPSRRYIVQKLSSVVVVEYFIQLKTMYYLLLHKKNTLTTSSNVVGDEEYFHIKYLNADLVCFIVDICRLCTLYNVHIVCLGRKHHFFSADFVSTVQRTSRLAVAIIFGN